MKFIIWVIVAISGTAYGQSNYKPPKDLKQEITKCAGSETALKRLACFDDLTERLEIDIRKDGEVAKTHEDPLKLQKERENAEHEQQVVRKRIIDDATTRGLIQKTTFPGDLIWIWVSPEFSGMDYDLKHKFIGIVRDYYTVSGKTKGLWVNIIDSKTGNTLGSYTPDSGLHLNR